MFTFEFLHVSFEANLGSSDTLIRKKEWNCFWTTFMLLLSFQEFLLERFFCDVSTKYIAFLHSSSDKSPPPCWACLQIWVFLNKNVPEWFNFTNINENKCILIILIFVTYQTPISLLYKYQVNLITCIHKCIHLKIHSN